MISGLSLAIRLSDIFKAVYLSWFAYEFGKLFPGRLKLIKLILLNLLAFGTFRIWRLHSVPHCKMDNEINLHAKTPEETCPGKLLVKAEAS